MGHAGVETAPLAHLQRRHQLIIYLVQGVPQVFRSVAGADSQATDDLWVYVPSEELNLPQDDNAAGQAARSDSGETFVWHRPIDCDGSVLYPIVFSGEVTALVASVGPREISLAGREVKAVIENVAVFEQRSRTRRDRIINGTQHGLIPEVSTYDSFLKRVLDLMTRQWPRTYGVVYWKDQGSYKLRLAAGNLGMSDNLDSTVSATVVKDWLSRLARGERFLPVDASLDGPAFLCHTPGFLMLKSMNNHDAGTEYLMALAVPGDIDREAMAVIQAIGNVRFSAHEGEEPASSLGTDGVSGSVEI